MHFYEMVVIKIVLMVNFKWLNGTKILGLNNAIVVFLVQQSFRRV